MTHDQTNCPHCALATGRRASATETPAIDPTGNMTPPDLAAATTAAHGAAYREEAWVRTGQWAELLYLARRYREAHGPRGIAADPGLADWFAPPTRPRYDFEPAPA